MRNNLIFLFLFVCVAMEGFSQQEFQKRYSGGRKGNCIKETPTNSFVIAGSLKLGITDYVGYFIKIDSNGNRLWSFKDTSAIYFTQCDITADSGYITIGRSEKFNSLGNSVIYLLKIDSSGSNKWERVFYDSSNFVSWGGIKSISDNCYLLFGSKRIIFGSNPFVAKLDSAGNILWQKGIVIDSFATYQPIDLLSINNSYLLMGSNFLVKLDTSGNVIWTKKYSGTGLEMSDITVAANGDYIVSALRRDSNSVASSLVIALDTSGNIRWNHFYSVPQGQFDTNPVLCQTANHGFYITGEYVPDTSSIPFSYYYFLEIDSLGNLLNASYFNFDINENYAKDIIVDAGNSVIILGGPAFVPSIDLIKFTSPSNLPCGANFNISTSTDSILVISLTTTFFKDIQDTDIMTTLVFDFPNPSTYCLGTDIGLTEEINEDIYVSPNPTTGQFVISSREFAAKNSLIEIYNNLGQKIYSTVYRNGSTVNCEVFKRGIYLVRLSDSEKQITRKLVID